MEATMDTPPDSGLRARMAGRVQLNLYLEVLNGLLVKVNEDLAGMMVGSLNDSASERRARQPSYDHLFAARARMLDAVSELQKMRDPEVKFPLGLIVVTKELLGHRDAALRLVWTKHARGKWGAVTAHDVAVNEASLLSGDRLVSVYELAGQRVFVITDGDRSVTTVVPVDKF